jgi:two-component system, LuxR family, response regulator FixJ
MRNLRLSKPPVIAIVDDDEAVREALCGLLEVEGLSARTFAGAADFLAGDVAGGFDCLITDVRMPETDGLALQRMLRARGSAMPVIFITSSSDEAARASALRDGAFAWLTKPVADALLLGALRAALGLDGAATGQPSAN